MGTTVVPTADVNGGAIDGVTLGTIVQLMLVQTIST